MPMRADSTVLILTLSSSHGTHLSEEFSRTMPQLQLVVFDEPELAMEFVAREQPSVALVELESKPGLRDRMKVADRIRRLSPSTIIMVFEEDARAAAA